MYILIHYIYIYIYMYIYLSIGGVYMVCNNYEFFKIPSLYYRCKCHISQQTFVLKQMCFILHQRSSNNQRKEAVLKTLTIPIECCV